MYETTTPSLKSDQAARQSAINPDQSYIIQAPAGSGKTELLIQRYLRLLTTCQSPSQVLAITFTKKAAGEMRHRIQNALSSVSDPSPPKKPHEILTWNLARSVSTHAKKLNWAFEHIASELSIMTIDACCQQFLRFCQPPFLLYGQFTLNLMPEPFYRDCITQFIQSYCLELDSRHYDDFQALLLHQHHDFQQVERLLMAALANREKWLSLTLQTKNTDFIELFSTTITHIQQSHIDQLNSVLPPDQLSDFLSILTKLNTLNVSMGIPSPFQHILDLHHSTWTLVEWKFLSDFLLSKSGSYRKRFGIDQGFANQSTLKQLTADDKEIYLDLKEQFFSQLLPLHDNSGLLLLLQDCSVQPLLSDQDTQCETLRPLFNLLPSLAAFLHLQMESQKCTDFSGINLQLQQALLDEKHSQHLFLQIYKNYQHVLIDEFQDTSIGQFRILELALSSWQGEPNRSICVVGDPMQSIYRFRQAEVKLFKQVQTDGFSGVKLINLQLSSNYRTCDQLITQLNHCFRHYMNPRFNAFYPSQSVYSNHQGGLNYHSLGKDVSQPHAISKLVSTLNDQYPNASKCLLVRSRTQLTPILSLFKQNNIPYTGIGLHSLSNTQAVLDCYNLICLPFDYFARSAWVGFLNSPAVAMPLADIVLVCQDKHNAIWDNLNRLSDKLSSDGQAIYKRIYPILSDYLSLFGGAHLHTLAKKTWHLLGFDLALQTELDHSHCELFFKMVSQLEHSRQTLSPESLYQLLETYPEQSHASSDNALNIMTIHKSKGLEFDIVIVPHLEKITPLSEKPILDWTYAQKGLDFHLLMHTHPRHKSHQNSIHKYLRSVEKKSELAEFERLYYVAFTRAKFQLHLLSDQKSSYPERSIMKKLARILDTNIPDIKIHQHQPHHKSDLIEQSSLRYCLPAFWTHPLNLSPSGESLQATKPDESPDFVLKELFDDTVCMDTQWGKLVHRFMELALHPNHAKLPSYEKFLQIALQFQIHQAHHDRALVKLFDKLSELPTDQHFVWLKDRSTNMTECTVILHGKKHIIDYIFIDNITHTLWIVDFKTSQINQFLSTGKTHFPDAIPSQYLKQLSTYATCLQPIFPNFQIQTALYYPLIPEFIKIK